MFVSEEYSRELIKTMQILSPETIIDAALPYEKSDSIPSSS